MYYNGYQYETSPRKLQPEYKTVKKQTNKKNKTNENKQVMKQKKKEHRLTILYVGAIFGLLFTICYRNAIISENFKKNKEFKEQLAAIQKENEQLEVNIESSLNLKNIEQTAKSELGMSKLDSSKTVYINLPKEDYIEPASEEIKLQESKSWFQEIIDMFVNK